MSTFHPYFPQLSSAKKNGQTDKMEADAISRALFKLLMVWSIEEGNIYSCSVSPCSHDNFQNGGACPLFVIPQSQEQAAYGRRRMIGFCLHG